MSRARRWSSSRLTATASRTGTRRTVEVRAGSASCVWRSTRSRARIARHRARCPVRADDRTEEHAARSSRPCSDSSPQGALSAQAEPAPASRRRPRPPSSAASTRTACSWISRATRGSRGWPGDDRVPAHLQRRARPRAGHPPAGGSWTQTQPVLLDAPGLTPPPGRGHAHGRAGTRARFELLAAAEHAERTTTPQPEGEDAL